MAESPIRCIADVRADVYEDDLKMQPCAGGLLLLDTDARDVPGIPFAG
jgi:hypothetical protein